MIFKVRDWDPSRHPRGYRGLFIDTPNKTNAGSTKVGDVVATQGGKVFRVEGHGAKGIKVSSVHQDTGEVLNKQTVIANGIQVGVVQSGKGVGTSHKIGDLDPGVFIQHPKSQKRFKISKHGNWTTVYPVDDQGEVNGKHTVLPKDTEVLVASKVKGGSVTPAVVQQVQRAQTRAAKPSVPATNNNPLGLKPGDQVRHKAQGDVYEVHDVTGKVTWVVDHQGQPMPIHQGDYEEYVPEVLPQNLAKPPMPYAPGVGEHSGIRITEVRELDPSHMRTVGRKPQFMLERIRDTTRADLGGPPEVLGTFNQIGAARKQARAVSAAHEPIQEARSSIGNHVFQSDEWVMHNGTLYQIGDVVTNKSWYGSGTYQTATFKDQYGNALRKASLSSESVPVPDIQGLRDWYSRNYGGHLQSGDYLGAAIGAMDLMDKIVQQNVGDPKEVRTPRPNLYLPQLQPDWKPDDLIGKSKGEALQALRKLGYGEVTPREPNMTKYVNAYGKRLHVHNKGGVVTAVDEIQSQATRGGGTGFHSQLQAVLDSGGDVRSLDPTQDPNTEAHNSHTRQLLYDMALGKQNGVETRFNKGAKVKSDAAYRAEIQADPAQQQALNDAAKKADAPPLNVPVRTDVMSNQWGLVNYTGTYQFEGNDPISESSEGATAAIALGERNGVAQAFKDQGYSSFGDAVEVLATVWGDSKTRGSAAFADAGFDQATGDYLTRTMQEIEPRGRRQWEMRQTEWDRRRDAQRQQYVAEETQRRRKAEGTVAHAGGDTFELPLWDDVQMKKQDIFEVESLIQNSKDTDQVPVFFTGGILRDGVAYGLVRDRKTTFEAKVPMEFDAQAIQRVGGTQMTNSRWPTGALIGSYSSTSRTEAGTMFKLDEGGGKYIEYVPHGNGGGGFQSAPTNQRGRLTLVGYTPEEATTKLKSLGLVHELENEVPFNSVMRSERRHGLIQPLHSDYVSGEADLPSIPAPIIHGMNGSNAEVVLDSGGLKSISERYQIGIPLSGTIPANDIRAGVDHVVFGAIGPSFSYGDVGVVYKDSAFLRRDILLTDRAFGTGNTRYPSYRNYQNKMRRVANDANTDENIYSVMSPAARQAHINDRYDSAGASVSRMGSHQNEWDVTGMPIEDMAAIVVPPGYESRINRKLDQMLAAGRISERPQVVVSGHGGVPSQLTNRTFVRVDPRTVRQSGR